MLIVICALQKHLLVIQGQKAGARQLLQQRQQALQRMRAVSEMGRSQVPLLRKDIENAPTQHPAQGKAEEQVMHIRLADKVISTSLSAHEGKLIYHNARACLKALFIPQEPYIISVNLLNYGYLFYRRNAQRNGQAL